MPKESNGPSFEGCVPATLFREFAAECMELAQTNCSPEKRALYLKMASVWHQMAQRWEKKSYPDQ
jgi:acid phosphatase class B